MVGVMRSARLFEVDVLVRLMKDEVNALRVALKVRPVKVVMVIAVIQIRQDRISLMCQDQAIYISCFRRQEAFTCGWRMCWKIQVVSGWKYTSKSLRMRNWLIHNFRGPGFCALAKHLVRNKIARAERLGNGAGQ